MRRINKELPIEETERPNTLNRANRPERNSINGLRERLSVKGTEKGFHYCWVNDDNVDSYLDSGYDFVTHNVIVGNRRVDVSQTTDGKVSIPVGNGVTGFLMRTPDDIFKEDFDAQQKDLDERDHALYRELNSKSDGRYGKVEIESSKPI